jgi:hypothetical protein
VGVAAVGFFRFSAIVFPLNCVCVFRMCVASLCLGVIVFSLVSRRWQLQCHCALEQFGCSCCSSSSNNSTSDSSSADNRGNADRWVDGWTDT